jgi:septal ring factor EnvC (AmiA/AmiB activator)
MDPQHLDRLDDDGRVLHRSAGAAGGSSATVSPEGPEVPAPVSPLDRAPAGQQRRSRRLVRGRRPGAGTILLRPDGLSDVWPLADVDAPRSAGTPGSDHPHPAAARPAGRRGTEVVATRTGVRHRRRAGAAHRPALYLVAALVGVVGMAGATASDSSHEAKADEPVSVAEELGMVQAEQPTLSEEEATSRLQQLLASRAEREDAQAAAAQVQADADRAATEAAAAAAAAAAEAARPRAVLPVPGARLSSGYGSRWGTLHAGVDFAAPIGTPEHAVMDGVVVRAGAASGFGLAVYIQHGNGDVTVYGHMQEVLVEEGQAVQAGDAVALLGNTGQSTGPHLHFEVHLGGIDGQRVDPLPWLRERGVAV